MQSQQRSIHCTVPKSYKHHKIEQRSLVCRGFFWPQSRGNSRYAPDIRMMLITTSPSYSGTSHIRNTQACGHAWSLDSIQFFLICALFLLLGSFIFPSSTIKALSSLSPSHPRFLFDSRLKDTMFDISERCNGLSAAGSPYSNPVRPSQQKLLSGRCPVDLEICCRL